MILFEFEGKELLKGVGIKIPPSFLYPVSDSCEISGRKVVKAQVLSGERKKSGGIVFVEDKIGFDSVVKAMIGSKINGEVVEKLLIEDFIEREGNEWYVSLSYSSISRSPVLVVSKKGGTGVERKESLSYLIDPLDIKIPSIEIPKEIISKILKLFFEKDCLLVEINPLVKSGGDWVALDAKIKLDDSAFLRHKEMMFPDRGIPGHVVTQREVDAKKIDKNDYRGTAGSAYFDLPGDIAILASGGGASLVAMDALVKIGGKPANYTEYSGNPPKEKVEKLAEIVLSRNDLAGLFVVGAVANFTDIFETLSGIVSALRKIRRENKSALDFPIVVRRGGPRDKEAFDMLKSIKDFDFHVFGEETSIEESTREMVNLANIYKEKKRK